MDNLKQIQQALNIVDALEITETPYRGLIIKMCETDHDVYTVHVLNSSGKLIHCMSEIPHWEEADMWAMGFIDGYLLRNGEA